MKFQGLEPIVQGAGLLEDARAIIEAARRGAYRAVNAALVQRNWLLGKRIAEEELKGEGRAEYGKGIVKELAEKLTEEYGNGFSAPALYQFVEFFRAFPILDTLCIKSGGILGWSHYRTLLQVKNAEARDWYKEEAGNETWSVRTLHGDGSRKVRKVRKEKIVHTRVQNPERGAG